MRWIRLDPPGEFCQIQAVVECLLPHRPRTFADVGCGAGSLSREPCRQGLLGFGVEPSPAAAAVASEQLAPWIATGAYRSDHRALEHGGAAATRGRRGALHDGDRASGGRRRLRPPARALDAARRQGRHRRAGTAGQWSFEDEVVGHRRRYDRDGLTRVLAEAGLEDIAAWSVAVPVANLLYRLSNRLVRRSIPDGFGGRAWRSRLRPVASEKYPSRRCTRQSFGGCSTAGRSIRYSSCNGCSIGLSWA